MNHNFEKIKVKLILLFILLIRKISWIILEILERAFKFIETIFFFIIKILIFIISPIYLKLKKLIKELSSNFHYQTDFFSLFNRQWLVILCFLIIVIFIFFEGKSSFQEEFFAQAITSEELNSNNHKLVSENIPLTESDEEAILKPNLIFEKEFIPTRTEIEKYVVQKGDTISSIAEDFGVSINTILWENKLTPRSIIRPGQVLKILPISGVSHTVKMGDNIEKIAKLYRADKEEIIRFNDLEKELLRVGDIIIIPEGKIPPPPPTPPVFRGLTRDKTWLAEMGEKKRQGIGCRDFYPGQCTWYVAQKYCIPWSGHAKSWLTNARNFGYEIGKEPKVGSIISLRETWYGHVAIVEEVKDNSIIISEMNHLGPWRVNRREIKINDPRINGYIYIK